MTWLLDMVQVVGTVRLDVTKAQECSTMGCVRAAAFTTRSRPAWCLDCIDEHLREGGLEAREAFTKPRAWQLTRCLACGIEAHYRLEYIVGNNEAGLKTCRACHWIEWARMSGHSPEVLSPEEIVSHLDGHGLDLVVNLMEGNNGNYPVVAKCRRCGRITAARMSDHGYGCDCVRNTRSSNPVSPRTGRILLTESNLPALQWWDHERNDEASLHTATVRATRQCHWVCPTCEHRFEASVNDMTSWLSCPKCSARQRDELKEEFARWKITPIANVPELAAAWAEDDDPRTVMVGDWGLRRFRCVNGHLPRISASSFLGSGCPHCRGAETAKSKKWLADTLPEIAAQWHPTKNGKLTPGTVVWDSKRVVWWRADCCGHEWHDSVRDRDKYQRLRCPACRTILGSMAWVDPGLAAEWSPANPISPWHLRPHAATAFVPEWICATNPDHVWNAPLSSRSNGAECPECRQSGKSRVELDHHAAAQEVFGGARSGITIKDKAFSSRKAWTVDISVVFGGRALVIEYDGAYWHRAIAKVLVDERKSLDLLAAGYLVVRLREDDLPSLDVVHPGYTEMRVYSTAPQPQRVVTEIHEWASGLAL